MDRMICGYQEQTLKAIMHPNSQKRKEGTVSLGAALWLLLFGLKFQGCLLLSSGLGKQGGGQKPHGSHTVRAETLQQELSSRMGTRFPSSQHPADMLASGTAGHIIICVSGNEPLPRCFLFLQGFQGSSLPSKSEKKRCELRHQLLRGVAHGVENPN